MRRIVNGDPAPLRTGLSASLTGSSSRDGEVEFISSWERTKSFALCDLSNGM